MEAKRNTILNGFLSSSFRSSQTTIILVYSKSISIAVIVQQRLSLVEFFDLCVQWYIRTFNTIGFNCYSDASETIARLHFHPLFFKSKSNVRHQLSQGDPWRRNASKKSERDG